MQMVLKSQLKDRDYQFELKKKDPKEMHFKYNDISKLKIKG